MCINLLIISCRDVEGKEVLKIKVKGLDVINDDVVETVWVFYGLVQILRIS